MRSNKTVKAYFLAGIIISSFCFAYGKSDSKLTDVGLHATDESYDQLQRLTDDDTLITTVQKSPRKHSHFTRANQGRITRITVVNAYKTPSKLRTSKLHRFRKTKVSSSNTKTQILRKIRHQDSSNNWLSRVVKKIDNSKKVIHRKSRDEETYESGNDDENIQSKDEDEDEDEDEDVQLIIIPRKPRKNLQPKVQEKDEKDEDTINDPQNNERISENSLDDSDNDHQNSRNFKDSNAKGKKLNKNRNDDATLTLERVVSDEDDDDKPKNSYHSGSNVGNYDLHLKVKDKSGTNVKLSGDFAGSIGNLMAVGEDGGTVQIKNTNVKENIRARGSEHLKTVDLQGAGSDATTDEMAQNLISIKSGKLKHPPYPSTVLLKPDAAVNEVNGAEVNEVKTNQARMPMENEGDNKNVQPQAFAPLTRDEANSKAEEPTNQQPSNNIFAPMEFENGDDELMATSRLLDIAQKADDVSSLKEVKEPSDTVKPESSKSLKDSANGAAKRQTSKAFLKSSPLSPEDYKNIDKEANENWYKLQRLEDRAVNEGSSARTGKDVGSYNGQKVSVITPSQLQLLQTEYPTYPAYLTPLLKSKVTGAGPPIVLPDGAIHGTQRNRFEIHDLTDISGGKWKAVHIPDENIASMLEIANQSKGGNLSMDIQHQERDEDAPQVEISGVKLPVEVHGRVHAFEHNLVNNKSRNDSASVGKLIVATENEHHGKEMGPLKVVHPSVLKLRGYMEDEGPKNREEIHRKTSVKPSLVVAKISEDDNSDVEEDLPLRKLPKPIVAPLRKTRPVIRLGSMRSNILAGVIHPSDKSQALSPSLQNSSNTSQQNSGNRNEVTDNHPTNNDPEVLEKIKSLLLKSHSKPTPTPVSSPKPQSNTQNNVPASTPNSIPPAPQVPEKVFPARPNTDGLFLPKFSSQTDAFSNHASVLNRISSPKKEALLIGIIKALLDRDRFRTSSARGNALNGAATGLPHYDRQAILQDLENLQMRKTVANSGNDAATPELDPAENTPMPGKSMDEIYQKEREEEVKKELARANEETLEANKMRQEESVMLANYDRFSNPESRSNWGNIGGTQQSETPDGQFLSMLGPQQLNMVEDNPSAT